MKNYNPQYVNIRIKKSTKEHLRGIRKELNDLMPETKDCTYDLLIQLLIVYKDPVKWKQYFDNYNRLKDSGIFAKKTGVKS